MDYINRKYHRSNSKEINQESLSFEDLVVIANVVSFVLGEPAAGKSFQLDHYDKTSKENTKFIQFNILDYF